MEQFNTISGETPRHYHFRLVDAPVVNPDDTLDDQVIEAYNAGKQYKAQEIAKRFERERDLRDLRRDQNLRMMTELVTTVLLTIDALHSDRKPIKKVFGDLRYNPHFNILMLVDRSFFFSEDSLRLIQDVAAIQDDFCQEYQVDIEFHFAVDADDPNEDALAADGYLHVLDYTRDSEQDDR